MIRRAARPLSRLALLAVLTVVAPGVPPALAQRSELVAFERSTLVIETERAKHRFDIELATTPEQQRQGLMFRNRMAADAGMLFIYDGTAPVSMWMKNTFIPLDMLFIDAEGKIVKIVERTVPQSLETISAGRPVTAVLEVNGGTTSRLGIKPGDRVVHAAIKPRVQPVAPR